MGNTATKPNATHPKRRSTVACKCGKVSLEFRNYETAMRIQCACFSCRQRQDWSVANACPGVLPYDEPCDLTWLDNAVTSVTAEDGLLKTHVLREGSGTRWLGSVCCKSVMVVSNALYNGNLVAIPRATCNLETHDAMPPQARIQTVGWSRTTPNEENMPAYTGDGPVLDGRSLPKMLWGLYMANFFGAMRTKPHREAGDRTVEEIMDSVGLVDLGIKEYAIVAQTDEAKTPAASDQ